MCMGVTKLDYMTGGWRVLLQWGVHTGGAENPAIA